MIQTMRAAVYARKAEQGVQVTTRPRPTLAPGAVLCRVACAGLNPVDAKCVMGDKFPPWLLPVVQVAVEGRTPGFDFAGEVVEAAAGVPFRAGDAIFGTVPPLVGTLREYVLAPVNQIAHKPKALSFAEAAALPLVGLTALQALRDDHHLESGQHLLLLGASGGVGHVTVQVAKALGARVTAICSGKNAALVTQLGADTTLDYTRGGLLESLHRVVQAHGPFHLCLDCVSSVDARDAGFQYERTIRGAQPPLLTGHYITIGGPTRDWLAAGFKRLTGRSLFAAGRELFWIRFPNSAAALNTLGTWANEGRLRPKVTQTFPLDDAGVQAAFQSLHSRRSVGKCVVHMNADGSLGADVG